MISNSEFEKLWVLYKTEGEPKGVSINAFCISRGVNYKDFNKWYYKMHKSIVPLEIEGAPASESQEMKDPSDEDPNPSTPLKKGGIHVFIRTYDGLYNFYFMPHFQNWTEVRFRNMICPKV